MLRAQLLTVLIPCKEPAPLVTSLRVENGQDEVQASNVSQKVRSGRSNNKHPGAGMHFSYDMHEPMDGASRWSVVV